MMTLTEFFRQARTADFWQSADLFQFVTESPVPLFSHTLSRALREAGVSPCRAASDETERAQQLSSSFLGTSLFYTIDFESAAKLGALTEYEGPHRVLFFSKSERKLARGLTVALEPLNDELYHEMRSWLGMAAADHEFVQQVFKRVPTMSIDTACLLLHYQQVMGKNKAYFFEVWFDRLIEPKRSLFTLSQHFFARDARAFYELWVPLSAHYPPEFWVAFWSEQLWQGMIFIAEAKQQGPLCARKAVSRLPFSFMQKDWQKYTIAQLAAAHHELYRIDYAHKHGSQLDGIPLWCARWLNNAA